ncbi:ribonuclease H-like domain-containing protein [Tanacetum coccineum]
MHKPLKSHLNIALKVLRYLKGSPGKGVHIVRCLKVSLGTFLDADWAKCLVTRKSVRAIASATSKTVWVLKDTLSRFSAEAEYRGVANAVAETSWIRNLLRELHTPLFTATLVYCDNVSAVYMSANSV